MDVLVVDDDPHIRDVIMELLTDEGYTAEPAANGAEALLVLQQQSAPPCMILLDLMMPQMNGWEFREAQRKRPEFAAIPVVTISAHADLLRISVQLDVVEHLAKPLDIDRLLAIVGQYCGAKGASTAL